ncbi:hypothetical protein CIT25_16940 [Mesorhizobium mediterraneum]|uniref:Propionyl-coenzyme A carboxylase alpha polypeptide n=1 Tax=Mesorhizobium mediterraneum TaxID=43617 RepID=A0AB36R854_9HYPH|nr:hypothetical protein CIT25_16940 [Mesorhizobium mediterraneum]
MSRRLSPIAKVAGLSGAPKLPISPQVGEMSGRTEGGAVELQPAEISHDRSLLAHSHSGHGTPAGLDPAHRHRSRRS